MLQIKNICKKYKTGNLIQEALNDVSLNLRDNEFVAILGPSGSGKTTLLNIIGGLDRYDKGDLIINDVSTKKYKDKDWDSYRNHTIGFVFQSYNLIGHQTILANVELALTISGVSKGKRKEMALKALNSVGLKEQAHKKPNQLSGGQMQRVAIARALVNDPDIILADEPTGALDTKTSVDVMELLKEVAKDRLVVMVTHNPELASNYATRIVNLKDGKIITDSNPFKVTKTKKEIHKNLGKTSMSFFTSLQLSFNNLKTKKGRTFLTAFAGSIGIIGIALILSLSNGVNSYIQSVEEDTLSQYPLQIQSTGIDMGAMLMGNMENQVKNEEGDIHVSNMLANMFETIGTNDLVALKEYLESKESHIMDYAKAIEYSYSVSPIIYKDDTNNLRQVNPDVSFNSLGIGSGTSSNSLMSSMMSTDVFFELPKEKSLYESQYDVKMGSWPNNPNELVLVLGENGSISDFLLYTLGLKDYKELDDMINKFLKEEHVKPIYNENSYSYEEIIGTTFKLVHPSDFYDYDKTTKLWKDKTKNKKYMKELVSKGEELKIVGIVAPKEKASVTMLMPGLAYTPSLTNYVIEKSSESKIVKEQLSSPKKNVFTGKKFEDKTSNSLNMNKMISVDQNALKSAFKIDASKIKVDFSNLNGIINNEELPTLDLNAILSEIHISISNKDMEALIKELLKGYQNYIQNGSISNIDDLSAHLTEYLNSKEAGELLQKEIERHIRENGSLQFTEKDLQKILLNVLKGYDEYAKKHNYNDSFAFNESLFVYLQSEEASKIMAKALEKIIVSQDLEKQISAILGKYLNTTINGISKKMENEITKSVAELSSSIGNAFRIDEKAFVRAFKMNMSEEELSEVFASLLTQEHATYENNLRKLNYANLEEPSGIAIYPKDFEGNEAITNLLSDYNNRMKENKEEDKVISYTDMVGTLMSSVTTIIDVISYVLIAFVSISLIVSSIMIGIITYISVLERKKEIGILRAIGASKKNISQVFNAETMIVGFLAGCFGIGITLLFLLPINKIIAIISDGANVRAALPISAGIVLILLSTLLTLLGGIIPAKKAAKEDPVLALRAE